MFFFTSCCQNFQTGEGYETRQLIGKDKVKCSFSHSLDDIKNGILVNQTSQIVKIKRSQYEQLFNSFKNTNKMWIDQQFPPEKDSLGDIKIEAKWRRLSEVAQMPCIFSGKLSSSSLQQDYIEQIFDRGPFYCTIAAFLEHEEIIRNLFAGVEYSRAGLYKIPLRIDGQIEEILIDDFVPVRSNGIPIFTSSASSEIWLYLLEKAWAKVNGGYSNIQSTPREIMKAFTWAPCEQIYMKQSEDERKKLWDKLLFASSKQFPCVCQTFSPGQSETDVYDAGFLQNQVYSLLEAFNIEDQKGRINQVIKMRSFVNIDNLKIQINSENSSIWSLICESQKAKNNDISSMTKEKIFFIRYQDFCKYFGKISLSHYEPHSNYISQTILADLKRGFLYKFDVTTEGQYNIELHQAKSSNNLDDSTYQRGTIVLVKDQNGQLSFVKGILTIIEKDSLLSVQLPPGKYVVYCKLDTKNQSTLSTQYSISIYSKHFTKIIKTQRNTYPDILQRAFLNFGRQNPRNKHNNDLMWISYRLFFKQGGFAFIAVGNKKQSNKKFLITFDEKDFIKMNFKLKKPFKNVENVQTLQVLPGQEKIILARCQNSINLKSLKFPPQLGIKIEPVDKSQEN